MIEATRIIAIRHGETSWNVDTRIQGQLDIELNEKGMWQAARAGQALADEQIDHIYTSDLARAHATARAIGLAMAQGGRSEPPLTPYRALRERAFGIFEGLTYSEIESRWPEESRRWRHRDPDFAPSGGESTTQVRERVRQAVNHLAPRHLGGCIVLVAHGGVMDQLYRLATQQDLSAPRTWELGNTAINRLLWTPEGLTLVGWADTQHLLDGSLDERSA